MQSLQQHLFGSLRLLAATAALSFVAAMPLSLNLASQALSGLW